MSEKTEEKTVVEKIVELASRAEKESERIPDPAELKAASDTEPPKLASAIMAKFKDYGYAHIRAIGPAAIGKAAAACDIARAKLMLSGIEAIQWGYFWEIEIDKIDPETGKKSLKTGHTTVCEPR